MPKGIYPRGVYQCPYAECPPVTSLEALRHHLDGAHGCIGTENQARALASMKKCETES